MAADLHARAAVDGAAAGGERAGAAGLTSGEAAQGLLLHGPNVPAPPKRPSLARLALGQLADPLVLLLLAAALISWLTGAGIEAAAIAAVIVLNAALGLGQAAAAERAMQALSQGFSQTARVVRDGVPVEVDASLVVPGDLLLVSEGDRIAADARLVEATALEVDESALTGESLPVAKRPGAFVEGTPLADREPMLFAATGVTRGHGAAVVQATGTATEIGAIQRLAAAARPPQTPLQRRLSRLARELAVVGVGLTVVLAAAMALQGATWHESFLVGVAVAVAAVPEGLVATVTVAFALGARAMARRGAIVRRLDAIETLGETTIVCTDKTGTLTENRIVVAGLRPAAGVGERELLAAALLASSIDTRGVPRGDPLEAAIHTAALERGIVAGAVEAHVLVDETPFDAAARRMARVYDHPEGSVEYSKGAAELFVSALAPDLAEAAEEWATAGFRVVGVARGTPGDRPAPLGLIAFSDPLRETAADSVAAARAAGIRVMMVTGDHPATARTVGRALGLGAEDVLARVAPGDKLGLVESLQADGEVVAMTGDGVNDAPALRRADVGVAMGRNGTEAAREAAAIVLTDDDVATIVAAIAEGRRIRDNIATFVGFLLSANLGEVAVFAAAVAAGLGAPLAVVQVLLVNLVTDGLPAVALARDPASPTTMTTPPRREDVLLSGARWLALALIGLLVGGATLASFLVGRGIDGDVAQTMAFTTLALSELVLVFAMRSPSTAAWRLPGNGWLVGSVLGSAVVVFAVVFAPATHAAFATEPLGGTELAVALALALLPALAVELAKGVMRTREGRP
ncbi:MAG: cation-translocating P-type ATPase [Pseudomonadota bacterium]